jgi:hypothetical protein
MRRTAPFGCKNQPNTNKQLLVAHEQLRISNVGFRWFCLEETKLADKQLGILVTSIPFYVKTLLKNFHQVRL